MNEFPSWWTTAIEAVKGDTSAVVACVVIIAGLSMLPFGINPWLAFGLPGAIYAIYGVKSLFDNEHRRKMALLDVQKIEAKRGQMIATRTKKSLEKRNDRRRPN